MEDELDDTDNRVTDSRANDDTWKLNGVGLLKDITPRRVAVVLFMYCIQYYAIELRT